MTEDHDSTFHSMGSDVRLLIGPPLLRRGPSAASAAEEQRAYVEQFAARLSRFREDSELSRLNRDPHARVPASSLLRTAVRAGIWAAERSGGLVDPTLAGALEDAGYGRSLDGCRPASLMEALAAAPGRHPARPRAAAVWRRISVDDELATVSRPPGTMVDTGGTGKGLCADAVGCRLGRHTRFLVDCGGDIAVGGVGAQLQPYEVEIEHPLTGQAIHTLRVGTGGVATSGLNVRIWRTPDGGFAHHLLDPHSGRPAWTGLIGVTALGSSALEAETLSKMALLLGPEGARRALAEHGGVTVRDDGEIELIGPLQQRRCSRDLRRAA
jgi:thiamine biosynthesis lipoprotein